MKKLFFIFLFLPVIVFAQERINLKNSILDSIIFFPVGDANIYNFDFKSYIFTIKEVKFEFLEKKPDTNIVILPITYEEFKKDFLNYKFNNVNKKAEEMALTKEEKMLIKLSSTNLLELIPGKVGQAIMHPISFLYNAFSRKAKLERLYRELVENEQEVYNLSQKYNKELVYSLTGLEGEELLDFMTFCKFSYYDLVKWSPEFIVIQIKKRYGDYEYYKAIEDY
jgi:hypothetical protein